MIKEFIEEWDGLVELSEEEEIFADPRPEEVLIDRLKVNNFLLRIRESNPEFIFIERNGGSVRDVGGSGFFEAWFINRERQQRIQTHFNYEYGYYALRSSLSKIYFTEDTHPGFMVELLVDIFENEGKYFIFRIKTPKIGNDPLDYSWRIPRQLDLLRLRR
jgi:hypothetical protein